MRLHNAELLGLPRTWEYPLPVSLCKIAEAPSSVSLV
jgi:hypothetical protein